MNLKEASSYILGVVAFAAIIVLGFALLYGIPWVSEKIYPITTKLTAILFPIALLSIPFALIKKARCFVSMVLYGSSYVFGLGLWVFSVIVAYKLWGLFGLIVGLILTGIGVVPVAFLASLFKGLWSTLGDIIFGLVLTFGSRGLALYIAAKAEN